MTRELHGIKQQQAAAREELRLLKRQEIKLLAMMADAAVAGAAATIEVGEGGGDDDSSLLGQSLQADDNRMTTAACSRLLLEREVQVQDFFEFASDREKLRENLDAGARGDAAYAGLTPRHAQLYRQKQAHNVDRAADPTTKGFKTMATAAVASYGGDVAVFPLLVLNYGIWRTVCGTVAFALLIGFVHSWTPVEHGMIASAFQLVWQKGPELVDIFISGAYTAPRGLRNGLMRATIAQRDLILRTPAAIKDIQPKFWSSLTWAGRCESLTGLHAISASVAATRTLNSKRLTCESLAHAPYFGVSGPGNQRHPGFFAKELTEDLLVAPFFPHDPPDVNEYQIAGIGALAGLGFIFGLESLTLDDASLLMAALHRSFPQPWSIRHQRQLALHDIQFQLCQYSRKCKNSMRDRRTPTDLGKQVNTFVAEALQAIEEGKSLHMVSARFREHIASLPDCR